MPEAANTPAATTTLERLLTITDRAQLQREIAQMRSMDQLEQLKADIDSRIRFPKSTDVENNNEKLNKITELGRLVRDQLLTLRTSMQGPPDERDEPPAPAAPTFEQFLASSGKQQEYTNGNFFAKAVLHAKYFAFRTAFWFNSMSPEGRDYLEATGKKEEYDRGGIFTKALLKLKYMFYRVSSFVETQSRDQQSYVGGFFRRTGISTLGAITSVGALRTQIEAVRRRRLSGGQATGGKAPQSRERMNDTAPQNAFEDETLRNANLFPRISEGNAFVFAGQRMELVKDASAFCKINGQKYNVKKGGVAFTGQTILGLTGSLSPDVRLTANELNARFTIPILNNVHTAKITKPELERIVRLVKEKEADNSVTFSVEYEHKVDGKPAKDSLDGIKRTELTLEKVR